MSYSWAWFNVKVLNNESLSLHVRMCCVHSHILQSFLHCWIMLPVVEERCAIKWPSSFWRTAPTKGGQVYYALIIFYYGLFCPGFISCFNTHPLPSPYWSPSCKSLQFWFIFCILTLFYHLLFRMAVQEMKLDNSSSTLKVQGIHTQILFHCFCTYKYIVCNVLHVCLSSWLQKLHRT